MMTHTFRVELLQLRRDLMLQPQGKQLHEYHVLDGRISLAGCHSKKQKQKLTYNPSIENTGGE